MTIEIDNQIAEKLMGWEEKEQCHSCRGGGIEHGIPGNPEYPDEACADCDGNGVGGDHSYSFWETGETYPNGRKKEAKYVLPYDGRMLGIHFWYDGKEIWSPSTNAAHTVMAMEAMKERGIDIVVQTVEGTQLWRATVANKCQFQALKFEAATSSAIAAALSEVE